jgi:hypothetical protein
LGDDDSAYPAPRRSVAGTRLCFDAICIPLALLPRIHDFRGLLRNRRYTRINQSDRGWGWVDRGRPPPDSPPSLPLHHPRRSTLPIPLTASLIPRACGLNHSPPRLRLLRAFRRPQKNHSQETPCCRRNTKSGSLSYRIRAEISKKEDAIT